MTHLTAGACWVEIVCEVVVEGAFAWALEKLLAKRFASYCRLRGKNRALILEWSPFFKSASAISRFCLTKAKVVRFRTPKHRRLLSQEELLGFLAAICLCIC